MTLTAETALPYPDADRAMAGLRVQLREQLLDAGLLRSPDGIVVTGPVRSTDRRGRVWYWYRGILEVVE